MVSRILLCNSALRNSDSISAVVRREESVYREFPEMQNTTLNKYVGTEILYSVALRYNDEL